MNITDERFHDRSKWSHGTWDDEPDRIEWRHANGMPCLIVRNHSGALCGYVGVAPGHPLHGVGYDKESPVLADALARRLQQPVGEQPGMAVMIAALSGNVTARPDVVFRVHGGLTYSDRCAGRICHVAKPGEPEDVWWFGFDCGHSHDVTPVRIDALYLARLFDHVGRDDDGTAYRSVAYVRTEVERLADQLAAIR